jgi:hypothetical protein
MPHYPASLTYLRGNFLLFKVGPWATQQKAHTARKDKIQKWPTETLL